MFNFSIPPPLALYIHIPWCVRKCPYCDFNSHESKGAFPEAAYVDALIRDLEQDLPRVWGRRVSSIFFGGGTPSLFSPESIDRLLGAVRARLVIIPGSEITLEANPGVSEVTKFRGFREAGVNRLSIGVQSFNDDMLRRLGRIHDGAAASRAAEAAQQAGFDNINLDLMFALPGQPIDAALADVRAAIQLAPAHISLYQLTIEPNTLFHHSKPTLPDDDTASLMQEHCQGELASIGYGQYEVSAYAQPGRRCEHNLNYWEFGDYLGIGAGAHVKISTAQGITRLSKLKHPGAYMDKAGSASCVSTETSLSHADAILEFMMNALRLTGGFAARLFCERTGLPITMIEAALREAVDKGFIEHDGRMISPTRKGQWFLNDLLQLFMPDQTESRVSVTDN